MAKRTDSGDERKAERERLLERIEKGATRLYELSTSPVRDEAAVLLKTMADILAAGVDSKAARRAHAIMLGGRAPDEDALAYREAVGVLARFGLETRAEIRVVRGALAQADERLGGTNDAAVLDALARVAAHESESGALADLYLSMEAAPRTSEEHRQRTMARTRLQQSINRALGPLRSR